MAHILLLLCMTPNFRSESDTVNHSSSRLDAFCILYMLEHCSGMQLGHLESVCSSGSSQLLSSVGRNRAAFGLRLIFPTIKAKPAEDST